LIITYAADDEVGMTYDSPFGTSKKTQASRDENSVRFAKVGDVSVSSGRKQKRIRLMNVFLSAQTSVRRITGLSSTPRQLFK
jgi:hypothetical protein